MDNFYTYLYRDEAGLPMYVGKGKGKRAWNHLRSKRTCPIQNKLRKLQREGLSPQPEFLITGIDEEFALFVEEEFIRKYGRKDNGTGILLNLTDGGEGISGYRHSDETKQIISFHSKNITQETRDKISVGNLGKIMSKEACLKISQSKLGKPRTQELKDKLRLANLGKKAKPETIEKQRVSMLGKNRRPRTEEEKKHLSEINKGKIKSPETIKKQSLALKGKPWSKARRAAQKHK